MVNKNVKSKTARYKPVAPVEYKTEKEKYQLLWGGDRYREASPGKRLADQFLELLSVDDFSLEGKSVVECGCGSGKGGYAIYEKSPLIIHMLDFTDNCLDTSIASIVESFDPRLTFRQHDLTDPVPIRGDYVFCTDVMEHIPPEDVDTVLKNIIEAADVCFINLSNVEDNFGKTIGTHLHLTVEPYEWWFDKLVAMGVEMLFAEKKARESTFFFKSPRKDV